VGEILLGLSLQFSKMSIWITSWTEVQCNYFRLRVRLFCGVVVNFRCVPVDRLPEINAPFWSGFFFQWRRTLRLAGLAPAFHQWRAGWALIRICSRYSCCCRFMRNRRRRRRRRLRRRRKL